MSLVLIFGVIPICKYMLYLIYVALFIISIIISTFYFSDPHSTGKRGLKRRIERKQLERQAEFARLRIYLLEKISEDEASSICSLGLLELTDKIQKGEISSLKTTHAFMMKALLESERLNCVTEFNPAAMKIAEDLDERFNARGSTIGPLHGIPVCIKEDHDVEGMDTTLGNSQFLYEPKLSSAVLVETLERLGAVPFCKTNVPQTLLSNGSHNPIFGATRNWINPELSPAGSSSGSASLVGAGGALFGTGSDFGGSLRAPAHFSGISSIKPTIGRLSDKGLQTCVPCVGLPSVPGILAKDSETVALVFKHLVENRRQHKLDPACAPMIWDQEAFSSKKSLTIGYFTSLPFFPPVGDTEETVRTAKVQLEKAGHKLVCFDMPDGNDGMEINQLFSQLASADGGGCLREILEKEPQVSEDVSETWPLLLAPAWKRALIRFMARQSWLPSYSKRLSMLSQDGACSSLDFWSIWRRRNELRTEVLDKMRESSIDALISPVFAFPAVNMEDTRKLISASYTQTWSLLDFPAGVTRFGTESGENIDSYDDEDDSLLKLAKKAAGNSKGMPIGLQVIGKPFEEEAVLRVMCLLDSLYTNPL